MGPTEYPQWESGSRAKLDEVARGIAALEQDLKSVTDRLAQASGRVSVLTAAATQTEGIGGPLMRFHLSLRESVAHAVSVGRVVEGLLSSSRLPALIRKDGKEVTFPPQDISISGFGKLTVKQVGKLELSLPDAQPWPEGPDRFYADVPIKALWKSETYPAKMRMCVEVHGGSLAEFQVFLACRPELNPAPEFPEYISVSTRSLILAKISRRILTVVASYFPFTPNAAEMKKPDVEGLVIDLYASRCDRHLRFYARTNRRPRYALAPLDRIPDGKDRAYYIDTKLFLQVINASLPKLSVGAIVVNPAANALTFEVSVTDRKGGKIGIEPLVIEWGIEVKVTVHVKVVFKNSGENRIVAESSANGDFQIDVKEKPLDIADKLPLYGSIKKALEDGLTSLAASSIKRTAEVFKDEDATAVSFALREKQSLIVIQYPPEQ
jgi:hypothetical protein